MKKVLYYGNIYHNKQTCLFNNNNNIVTIRITIEGTFRLLVYRYCLLIHEKDYKSN